jgi:hypothetical protein
VVRGVGIYEWWCAAIRGVLVRVGARVLGEGCGDGVGLEDLWQWGSEIEEAVCGSGETFQ